ncbi:hypothetical protein ATANTOWER_004301 [Ataeniobius toweri]|uniref:Uncharacterized protein n=1 Tax=Ataeniobius toweri TaxID=208326 RepID=A0ABU7CEI9_9TELE|nr:hypothetical protein [Ataeniobius toweri]
MTDNSFPPCISLKICYNDASLFLQLLSHCAAVCPGRRYAHQLLLRSLPLRPSPVSACSPDCRRVAAPGLGCKLLITDGCDMTPVGDAITEAFAREKRAIQFRVCQQTLRSTRLLHGGHI